MPAATVAVAVTVDQDEASGLPNLCKAVQRDRSRGGDVANADFIERERMDGFAAERLDVDPMFDGRDACRNRANANLEQILATGQKRLLAHPDQMRLELIGDLRPTVGRDQRVAARNIDMAVEPDGDRLAGAGLVAVLAGNDDAAYFPADAGKRHLDRIALAQCAAGDHSCVKPAVAIGPQYVLYEDAQRRSRLVGFHVNGFQMPKQARSVMPGRMRACRGDVVAVECGERNGNERGKAKRFGKVAEPADDAIINGAVPVHEIELVHRKHEVTNAHHMRDHRVPARLRQQAPARVDQNDREIGVRGAACRIARITFVTRRISDDEGAPRRRKIAVGDVDGNALFALVL